MRISKNKKLCFLFALPLLLTLTACGSKGNKYEDVGQAPNYYTFTVQSKKDAAALYTVAASHIPMCQQDPLLDENLNIYVNGIESVQPGTKPYQIIYWDLVASICKDIKDGGFKADKKHEFKFNMLGMPEDFPSSFATFNATDENFTLNSFELYFNDKKFDAGTKFTYKRTDNNPITLDITKGDVSYSKASFFYADI